MFNTRAAMGWDVPFVGHPSMSSGDVANLVEKQANWEKVYAIGYRSCSFDAAGKLPPRSQELVDRSRARSDLADTLLWWVAGGIDAVNLVAKAVERPAPRQARTSSSTGTGCPKYPGYFGDYTFTPTEHNGYPTEDVVMSEASSARDGTFALAPGYKRERRARGLSSDARLDHRRGARGGRDLRAHRRHLQHHVRDLAGDELHGGPARRCSAGCSGRCSRCASACRSCRPSLLTLAAAAPSSASSPSSWRCGRC